MFIPLIKLSSLIHLSHLVLYTLCFGILLVGLNTTFSHLFTYAPRFQKIVDMDICLKSWKSLGKSKMCMNPVIKRGAGGTLPAVTAPRINRRHRDPPQLHTPRDQKEDQGPPPPPHGKPTGGTRQETQRGGPSGRAEGSLQTPFNPPRARLTGVPVLEEPCRLPSKHPHEKGVCM